MTPNIILIGFPKSLKTQIAKAYARICKRRFYDMSSQIVKSNLRSKNKFIAQKYMVRKFAKMQDCVLTLSSGILASMEVQKKLSNNIFVYLQKVSEAKADPILDKIYTDHAKITVMIPEEYPDYKVVAKKIAQKINEDLGRI